MKTVGIMGVGLIGGSFALALRKVGFSGNILGVSSPATLSRAVDRGIVDRPSTLEQAARASDLIFLAQPVKTILATIPRLAGIAKPGALITDAGSTKFAISVAGRAAFLDGRFVGGHPLAGKESRGVDAAGAELFRGRTWVLTPDSPEHLETPAAVQFLELLEAIGAIPVIRTAAEHDRVLAFTSHLPQLASTALSAAVFKSIAASDLTEGKLFGPALIDSTRLALSPFSVWSDIFSTNHGNIRAALDCFIMELQQLKDMLGDDFNIGLERSFSLAAGLSSLIRRSGA